VLLASALVYYGAIASVAGARRGRAELTASGRRAVYALALVLTIAFAILEAAFLRSEFSPRVVGTHSSTMTPAFYRATAVWLIVLAGGLLALWPAALLAGLRRQASGMLFPRSSSGRGPKMRRSPSSIATSLMLASRRRM